MGIQFGSLVGVFTHARNNQDVTKISLCMFRLLLHPAEYAEIEMHKNQECLATLDVLSIWTHLLSRKLNLDYCNENLSATIGTPALAH